MRSHRRGACERQNRNVARQVESVGRATLGFTLRESSGRKQSEQTVAAAGPSSFIYDDALAKSRRPRGTTARSSK